jgi:hypothetical protein
MKLHQRHNMFRMRFTRKLPLNLYVRLVNRPQ